MKIEQLCLSHDNMVKILRGCPALSDLRLPYTDVVDVTTRSLKHLGIKFCTSDLKNLFGPKNPPSHHHILLADRSSPRDKHSSAVLLPEPGHTVCLQLRTKILQSCPSSSRKLFWSTGRACIRSSTLRMTRSHRCWLISKCLVIGYSWFQGSVHG